MARGDSEVRVRITGDAKSLNGALKSADRSLGSTVKTAGGVVLGLAAVKGAFDFLGDSTNEADRLADATQRLNIQLGEAATAGLGETADDFARLGQSKQDILELEAAFADIATGTGIAELRIADLADNVAATAAAAALLGDADAATIVEQIGKASGGSTKAMKALGVSVNETEVVARALAATGKEVAADLTDGELAAARLAIILEQLKPKLDAATTGTLDLEQSQVRLNAQVETLQASLGGPLSDALVGVLGFINDEIEAIPHAIEGWQMLGATIEGFARFVLTPLANVAQALQNIQNLLNSINANLGMDTSHFSDSDISAAQRRERERNGLSGTMGNP